MLLDSAVRYSCRLESGGLGTCGRLNVGSETYKRENVSGWGLGTTTEEARCLPLYPSPVKADAGRLTSTGLAFRWVFFPISFYLQLKIILDKRPL